MAIKQVQLIGKPIGRTYQLPCVKRVPSSHMVALENEIRETLSQNESRRAANVELASKFSAR